ncbi:HNH endonuclease family protein [Dactylosporangium sp. CA-139066]|uniref:HNH endonuclease family protein n=1 Tax=Dactylosporangium sp. CA-139066 TaxID=3239930 RepID=UPI003D920E4A
MPGPAGPRATRRRVWPLITAGVLGAFLLGLLAAAWAGTGRTTGSHPVAEVTEAPDLSGLDGTTPATTRPATTTTTPAAAMPTPPPAATPTTSVAPAKARVADLVAEVYQLPIVDAPVTAAYARDRFGPAWSDTDGNGCDTRNDVLRRDLQSVVTAPGDPACTVVGGVLTDPYGGSTVTFEKGVTSDQVEIDHVVALADAWRSGASAWTDERRLQFANDPRELQATTVQQNRAKGDANAADWLPATGRCAYVARQVEIKSAYGLSVTTAERDAFVATLTSCGCPPAPTS